VYDEPFLLRPLAAVFLASLSLASSAEIDPASVKDFTGLQALVAELAHKPYLAPSNLLDPFSDGLKYDGHRQIRFKAEAAHYGELTNTFRVEFFHPGWTAKKTVGMYELGGWPGHTGEV